MAGGEQFFPDEYLKVIDGETELPVSDRGSELMQLRDEVPFYRLLEEAWVQLGITFDEPLMEMVNVDKLKLSDLERVSSLGVLMDVREQNKDIGFKFVKGWENSTKDRAERCIRVFENYRLGDNKHSNIWLGAGLHLLPIVDKSVDYDFCNTAAKRMTAIADRMERDYGIAANDFERQLEGNISPGDLMAYLAALKMMSLVRKQALLPITNKINRLQWPGVMRSSLENKTEDGLREYFSGEIERIYAESESHHWYFAKLAGAVLEYEEEMFGEEVGYVSEMWRSVWFMRMQHCYS